VNFDNIPISRTLFLESYLLVSYTVSRLREAIGGISESEDRDTIQN